MERISRLIRGQTYEGVDWKPMNGSYETPYHNSRMRFENGVYRGGEGFANFGEVDLNSLEPVDEKSESPADRFFAGLQFYHVVKLKPKKEKTKKLIHKV